MPLDMLNADLQEHHPRAEILLRNAATLATIIDAPDAAASPDDKVRRIASDNYFTGQPLNTTARGDKPPAFPKLLAAFEASVPPPSKKSGRGEHNYAVTHFLQSMSQAERAALKLALDADVEGIIATVRGAATELTFDGAPLLLLPSSSSSGSTTDTRAAIERLRNAAGAQIVALNLRIAKLDRAYEAMDLVDASVRAADAFDRGALRSVPPLTAKNAAAELKRDAKRAKKQ